MILVDDRRPFWKTLEGIQKGIVRVSKTDVVNELPPTTVDQ